MAEETTLHAAANPAAEPSWTEARAARELELRRGELDLAVLLGLVRSVPDPHPGRRRVTVTEIERLRAARGFPHTLRDRVHVVGTADGAALLKITEARFTRLARAGLFVPVRFYLNRYHSVVWHYLADDLRQFAESNGDLLTGRVPETMRARLDAGEDTRARNWRARRSGILLRLACDGWSRAAIAASTLPEERIEDAVPDPWERAHLRRLRPRLAPHPGPPGSPRARRSAAIQTADDPDEVRWLLVTLGLDLDEARRESAAPRPADPESPRRAAAGSKNRPMDDEPAVHRTTAHRAAQMQTPPSRTMLGWLRRLKGRPDTGRPDSGRPRPRTTAGGSPA